MTERLSERVRRERADILARETARVLGEHGCFRLRIDEVARAAGVGKGTVYLDHPDKASLVGASLARSCTDLVGEMARRMDGISHPGERLLAAVRLLARAPIERPDLVVLLEHRLACSARWIGADVTPYARLVGYLGSVVEEAQRATGRGCAVPPELAAQAILAVVSTPAWRRAAAEEGSEHAVGLLIRLMPGLFTEVGAAAGGGHRAGGGGGSEGPSRGGRAPRPGAER